MMDFELTTTIISIVGSIIAAITAIFTIYTYKRQKRHLQKVLERLARESTILSLQESPINRGLSPQEKLEQDYLKELARVSPSAAIIASWYEVERALSDKSSIERKNVEDELQPETRSLLNELRGLRNKIAHMEDVKVDQSLALKLVELAGKISQDIRDTRPAT